MILKLIMGIFIGWLVFSIVVGAIGSNRKIGFFMAFIASIFLSPLIGLIITLVSKDNSEEKLKKELIEVLKKTSNKDTKKQEEKDDISSLEYIFFKKKLDRYIEKKKFLTSKDSFSILSPSDIKERIKEVCERIKDTENIIEQIEKQEKLGKAYELNLISEEVYKKKKEELRNEFKIDAVNGNSYVLLSDLSDVEKKDAHQLFDQSFLESDMVVIHKYDRRVMKFSIEAFKKVSKSLFLVIIGD